MEADGLLTSAPKRANQGMIVLGLLSLWLGPLAGVPGLVWSRKLRPFSRSVRIGYSLCWFGCVGLPWLWYLNHSSNHFHQDAGWIELAVMLFFSFLWIAICRKFLIGPARSKRGAFLIAFFGTLFLGAVSVPAGFGSLTFPMLIAIPFYINFYPVPLWVVAVEFLLPALFVFPAHLAVYWPIRSNLPLGDEG